MLKLSPADSVFGALTSSAEHRDLAARAACANAAGAAALVSVHFNAFGDPSVGGTEAFYDSARTFSAENRRLATDLQAGMTHLGSSDLPEAARCDLVETTVPRGGKAAVVAGQIPVDQGPSRPAGGVITVT